MSHAIPKIFITMDTDWCPAEVLQYALALFEKHALRCTIFTTGYYAALATCDSRNFEIGVHPNFNDATVAQYERKLRDLLALYPNAQGVSSHAMLSSTPLLHLFKQAGLRYERNLLRYKEVAAKPFYYFNQLLRVPIFWEDDIWFSHDPHARFAANLFAPADLPLVFNFHPIHLFLNTASLEHYARFKPDYHNVDKLVGHRYEGYGVHSFFQSLITYMNTQQIACGLLSELVTP